MIKCKNCHTELHKSSDYCYVCGARVIRNRLTFKNLFEHISETFFNYDNKLLRTFIDLLIKPDLVIGGYINGIRKRYVNPLSYLGIALTLSGLLFFIMAKTNFEIDVDVFNQGIKENTKDQLTNMTSEYSSFFFLSYIPILVVSSWLILTQQKYNFTERTVTFIYAMAEYSLFIFLPAIIVVLFFQELYMTYSFVSMILLVLYLTWLLYRISKVRDVEFFGQIIVFFMIFIILFIGFYLVITIIGFLTGQLNIQDFAPQRI